MTYFYNILHFTMHLHFSYAKTVEAYNYDYTLDCATWAIALIHYWCTHAFRVANCNGFFFNAYPLGLSPNGTLRLSMVLYDPHTMTYVNNNEDICLTRDVDAQILYFLFTLMNTVQPHIHYKHDCCSASHNHAL